MNKIPQLKIGDWFRWRKYRSSDESLDITPKQIEREMVAYVRRISASHYTYTAYYHSRYEYPYEITMAINQFGREKNITIEILSEKEINKYKLEAL